MSDLIDRQAAIDAICDEWCGRKNDGCYLTNHCDGCDDVKRIKELPSAEPDSSETKRDSSDLISRKDALRPFCINSKGERIPERDCDNWQVQIPIADVKKILREVPSAEPQIIRCKDCKHYKEWESEFTPNAVVTQCMADNFPISKAIPDGWFCAGAERRTDE